MTQTETSQERLNFFESPKIDIILAPWGFGGTDNLAQEGAHSFIENDMIPKIEATGMKTNLIESESLGPFEISEEPKRIRNIEAISQINSWLAKRVEASKKEGSTVLMLGGDASLSIATVSGLINAGEDIGILWINNHLANSSPEVTKSWNANRMAFTVISSEQSEQEAHKDFESLRSSSKIRPLIQKDKIVQLGIRHKSAQSEASHKYFTMEDIEEMGVKNVIKEAIDYLSSKAKQIHVIWDLNSLNLSGVSNYSLGQLTYREALVIAKQIDIHLRRKNILSSIDVVEHCPSREAWDKKGETAEWMADIIAHIFGENIFNCLRKY